jgi:hypothetical protein
MGCCSCQSRYLPTLYLRALTRTASRVLRPNNGRCEVKTTKRRGRHFYSCLGIVKALPSGKWLSSELKHSGSD